MQLFLERNQTDASVFLNCNEKIPRLRAVQSGHCAGVSAIVHPDRVGLFPVSAEARSVSRVKTAFPKALTSAR